MSVIYGTDVENIITRLFKDPMWNGFF